MSELGDYPLHGFQVPETNSLLVERKDLGPEVVVGGLSKELTRSARYIETIPVILVVVV